MAARTLQRWSQGDLASASNSYIPSINRLEASTGPIGGRDETESAIRAALEAAGVEFIPENGAVLA